MSPLDEDIPRLHSDPDPSASSRKFGKEIQKHQLAIPEYAASFVDYKALKKLIKKLSATPVIAAQGEAADHGTEALDPQASLQANKATFFFRLERELEKVNIFYLQKEAELSLRLTTLLDKKSAMQLRGTSASRASSRYLALDEGFRQFSSDLDKLQQFVEVNATAFSKILKKWDKTSKSRTKELYLSRAVEVQPCFNRDVISRLSDQATTSLLELGAWAEGEKLQFPVASQNDQPMNIDTTVESDVDLDSQTLQSIVAGNVAAIDEWTRRIRTLPDAQDRITKAFLSTIDNAPDVSLRLLLNTDLVNLSQEDEINERNCLHKAAISGRRVVLEAGLRNRVDVREVDVYGRIPLHYACMHGHVELIDELVQAAHDSVNFKDQDGFTPLIHAIVHSQLECVQKLLSLGAEIDSAGPSHHIPLNLACQYGSRDIVKLLLQQQPQIIPDAEGLYPQHLVARSGKLPQLLLLLKEYGADLDQPDKLYQWTPLFHAASEGHVECLKVLLQNNVNANIPDEKGLFAMYYATWEGHLECMQLLAPVTHSGSQHRPQQISPQILGALPPPVSSTTPMPMEADSIPDLSLPPPIIPLRRYGHNFLDSKTFVVINFGGPSIGPVEFFDNHKYPAARLTISSKSTDLIPRNILLPMQEEFKTISFQIDNLETFSIEFDIYPTFGSKVIAHAAALSRRFTSKESSSGQVCLEMFDPRLRVIGCINFKFQIVKPFQGIPLEITHFATYWKATSQFESHPNALITGSSLSGEYVRIFVQMTADGVPVLYPQWSIRYNDLDVSISNLTYEEFARIGTRIKGSIGTPSDPNTVDFNDLQGIHRYLATSFATLEQALSFLPPHIHVDLHVLYPRPVEERQLRLGCLATINDFADTLLSVVFDHARHLRDGSENVVRSVVFSSFNQDICTALNWKQPNYPILLCNELGSDPSQSVVDPKKVQYSGRTTTSVKEAVQIAQSNNFMGLICSSRLLELAPALIEAIKTAGLVLVTDISDETNESPLAIAAPTSQLVPDGVDGFLRGNGILRFNETIDM